MEVRTRFAPSPTGFVHLGNIRSALFPWALAKKEKGKFILRIEDTDVERSTMEAVEVILQSLHWLGMDFDEGPYFQSKRLDRYYEVLDHLLKKGYAYECYMSKEELDLERQRQRELGRKPKYNCLWRPEPDKILPTKPVGVKPVVRFKNPIDGEVSWRDLVKGAITVNNSELDDFILLRSDGMPTYNFSVVVDDIDMCITHVIRGDDHVNNTPRQINLFHALSKAEPPLYAHLPTVLEENGEKMSKRNGAKSLMDYREQGFLPEAVINYLARLGWAHGNDELFSVKEFLEWFDLNNLSKSSAQFDLKKILSVNSYHLSKKNDHELAELTRPFLEKRYPGIDFLASPDLNSTISLFRSRSTTLLELADNISIFYVEYNSSDYGLIGSLDKRILYAIQSFYMKLSAVDVAAWRIDQIAELIKETLNENNLKMPELAKPLRLILFKVAQTPSLDCMLYVLGKSNTLQRLGSFFENL